MIDTVSQRDATPWAWLMVLLAGLLGGCRPALEQSPDAVPLPAVDTNSADSSKATTEWPGFRGPNTSGISPDQSLPVRFGPTTGVRWSIDVPGVGNSSPVVWGDYVFLTSAVGPDEAKTGTVLALDRADGRIRWRDGAASLSGDTHVKNGYASASVATDGERIVAFFGSAGLYCYNFSGQLQWRADLGPLRHVWGSASSPVLYSNLVIQLCDSGENSFIAAFDKTSGERVWATQRESYGAWSTPVLMERAFGGKIHHELIVNGTGTDESGGGWVIAYDPRDGSELWRVQGTTDIVSPTTIICPTTMIEGGLVISTSGRNGPTIAIRPGGRGNVTDTHIVWRLRRGGAYVPTGLAYRNRLFTISDGGVAACYNAGNGEQSWRERLRGAFSASLVAGAGQIYATSESGSVYVFAADDEFRLLATNDMNERCLATPAISDGDLFIRTESRLYCIPTPATSTATANGPSTADAGDNNRLAGNQDHPGTSDSPEVPTRPTSANSGDSVSQHETIGAKATAATDDRDAPDSE